MLVSSPVGSSADVPLCAATLCSVDTDVEVGGNERGAKNSRDFRSAWRQQE